MAIPENITKNHLLQAIEKIDKEGIPKDADSRFYDVIYNGNKYPPKLIVSYANLYANDLELDRNSFGGGLTKQSFKLLEDNGFIISPKISKGFFEELNKFLAQAKTNELKTSNYITKYAGLKVKVSFGQGNLARVPWISFLGNNQATSNGIYPVYLLYKDYNKLILAYGISEKNKPSLNWVTDAPTLANYFKNNNIGDPKPYPNSFVFKCYDLTNSLDEIQINSDLYKLIEIYKKTLADNPNSSSMQPDNIDFVYKYFNIHAKEANLFLSNKISLRFIASLLTKPFVILTGLSGSGKTKLAQAFAKWICESENQYCMVPVGADWTNREPILGFPNALEKDTYVKPDNKSLDLIIEANKIENAQKPYFLILDEMNLSHVERYFADFLSVMESKNTISLHTGSENWSGVPAEIGFPKNLFIIGTVNIDETTYMFSPKVLDRANVLEFRVTADEMKTYLKSNATLNLDALEELGAKMASSFMEIAKNDNLVPKNPEELNIALIDFFNELKKMGAEFGYRSAAEIIRFAAVINTLEPNWKMNEIIDAAIMQKLLPKVHGSRRKLEPVLKTLATLCLQDGQKFEDYLKTPNSNSVKYPISLEKISRMYDNLLSNGFTSYAEA